MREISFNKFYKSFNILSIVLIVTSLILLAFKGLNYGVDFKGGTLIELRTDLNSANIKKIRDSFNQLNLGDVSVKNFGKINVGSTLRFPLSVTTDTRSKFEIFS